MAEAKGGALDSIKAGLGSLISRLPFAKRPSPSAPEPFSTVEDETPLGDLLDADNAAPVSPSGKAAREKPDLGAAFGAAIKSPPVMIAALSVLGFLLIAAFVAIVVSSPPKKAAAEPPFTKEGEALVKTWLPPPGDPLSPNMEMERGAASVYSPADAARLGLPKDPLLMATLGERNDAAIEDLYGTVP
jgi:hypothetical protein